jgi:hypothetical protein
MTTKGRLSILRLAASGILLGLLFGAINTAATAPAAGAFAVWRSAGPITNAGGVHHARGSSGVVQSKQMSGRDNVVAGSGGGGGDSAAGICNADTAEHQCVQSNSAPDVFGAWVLLQGNQLSGRDSILGGAGGGGGNNASGVCNAATAVQQCGQSNTAVVGSGDAGSLAQGNQISGRDSVAGSSGGAGGNSASGVCNAATAVQQCDQSNTVLVGAGDGTSVAQGNQISGRDSIVGGSGGAGGDNGSGVCNAATATQQCVQANTAMVGTGDAASVAQGNQISGRDSVLGGAGGGGGNNASGVCNAATAAQQCEQTNTALVGTGGSASVTQGNQISGRDSAAGGAGGGGDSAAGVCNAATADHQCEQANTAQIDQSAGTGNAATVSQNNQISGRDSAAGGTGSAGADNANGVCNAATATQQCNQTNTAQVAQKGAGGNTATVSQSNQISGPDACNAATAQHQCGQTNVANVTQSGGGNNTAAVSQSNQISGQGACNAATAEHQCELTNVSEVMQSSSGANSATVSQSSQVSTRADAVGG